VRRIHPKRDRPQTPGESKACTVGLSGMPMRYPLEFGQGAL
jgi:hypothetical protein